MSNIKRSLPMFPFPPPVQIEKGSQLLVLGTSALGLSSGHIYPSVTERFHGNHGTNAIFFSVLSRYNEVRFLYSHNLHKLI